LHFQKFFKIAFSKILKIAFSKITFIYQNCIFKFSNILSCADHVKNPFFMLNPFFMVHVTNLIFQNPIFKKLQLFKMQFLKIINLTTCVFQNSILKIM